MSEQISAPTMSMRKRRSGRVKSEEQLPKWLTVSFGLHAMLIALLFAVSFMPMAHRPAPPVYVVDLLGGEKIGRANFGTEITPVPKQRPKPLERTEPAPPVTKKEPKATPVVVEKKTVAEPRPTPKPAPKEKVAEAKPLPKETPAPERVKPPAQDMAKSRPTKESKSEAKPELSADDVRERLIQAAAERAKTAAASAQTPAKAEALSAGAGEGDGAASLGVGGRGGAGVLKGMDFIIYQNRMLSTIKYNWAWVGQRPNLMVVVHFGIKENGEITDVRVVRPSGDVTYDESVLRAVKKSSPLPAPPKAYRNDFADVELTFRPRDLGA